MKHLNLELEKLEERIAPWGTGGTGSNESEKTNNKTDKSNNKSDKSNNGH